MTEPASSQPKPWDRQPDEPVEWFIRFAHFCSMGPRRSMAQAYRTEPHAKHRGGRSVKRAAVNSAPLEWLQTAEKWNWRKRAEAWDLAEIDRERAEYQIMAREAKRKRLKAIEKFRAKINSSIQRMGTDNKMGEITGALRTLHELERLEYGESTSKAEVKVSEGSNYDEILNNVLGDFAGAKSLKEKQAQGDALVNERAAKVASLLGDNAPPMAAPTKPGTEIEHE